MESKNTNIFYNLALEEELLKISEKVSLLLWQSQDAVVIGKHQNPWKECNMEMVRRKEITIARRYSGGGSVFHDMGNLNFSLFSPRYLFSHKINFAFLKAALSSLGINKITVDGGLSIFLEGGKISGSAFYYKKDRVLHHGTFLVNSDLQRLREALAPGLTGIKDRSVPSRRAPVINLSERNPQITITRLKKALKKQFVLSFPGEQETISAPGEKTINETIKRYQSLRWIYGFPGEFKLEKKSIIPERRVINTLEFTEKYFSEKILKGVHG